MAVGILIVVVVVFAIQVVTDANSYTAYLFIPNIV